MAFLFIDLSQYFSYNTFVFALRIIGLNAAKEKLEIVSSAAPPPFRHTTTAPLAMLEGCRIFAGLRLAEVASATQAGGFPRPELVEGRNVFGLIQEYSTNKKDTAYSVFFVCAIIFPRICAGFGFYLTFIEIYCKIALNSLTI